MPSPKRVWIVNHYADAPDRPIGTRHYDLARQLGRRGYRVTVFAASLSHVTGRDQRLREWQLTRRQWFDGVEFVWIRTFPYRGNSWRRRINMLSFLAGFLVVQARQEAPNVIIGSTVHPFAALGAWIVAKLRGARFVFEVRDLWPQTLVDLGELRQGSFGERGLRAIEAKLVRAGRPVLTLLPGMADYLRQQGLPTDHLVYLPNGVDLATFDRLAVSGGTATGSALTARNLVDRLRADGRFVIGYTGSFGRVNRLATVIEAARIAEERAPGCVGLVLIGDGPERDALEQLAAATPGVVVGPAVARSEIPSLLMTFDAAVVHATATPVYRYGISFNKLFEYMAASRPVAFACASAYDPVASERAGVTVTPDRPDLLADAYLQLATMPPAKLETMGRRGRAYVAREHSIENLGSTLASALEARPRQTA